MAIPAFTQFGPRVRKDLRRLAEEWVQDPERPRVTPTVGTHWRELVRAWSTDPSLPLLVRAGGNRGEAVTHGSGRTLVRTDNSPANWAFASALLARTPSAQDALAALVAGQLPVAMVLKRAERQHARYSGLLRATMDPPNLNTLGWKVAHIDRVGLADSAIEDLPLADLQEHLRRFLDPSNMFLVPKLYAGLGELPEFLEAFRSARARGPA